MRRVITCLIIFFTFFLLATQLFSSEFVVCIDQRLPFQLGECEAKACL